MSTVGDPAAQKAHAKSSHKKQKVQHELPSTPTPSSKLVEEIQEKKSGTKPTSKSSLASTSKSGAHDHNTKKQQNQPPQSSDSSVELVKVIPKQKSGHKPKHKSSLAATPPAGLDGHKKHTKQTHLPQSSDSSVEDFSGKDFTIGTRVLKVFKNDHDIDTEFEGVIMGCVTVMGNSK